MSALLENKERIVMCDICDHVFSFSAAPGEPCQCTKCHHYISLPPGNSILAVKSSKKTSAEPPLPSKNTFTEQSFLTEMIRPKFERRLSAPQPTIIKSSAQSKKAMCIKVCDVCYTIQEVNSLSDSGRCPTCEAREKAQLPVPPPEIIEEPAFLPVEEARLDPAPEPVFIPVEDELSTLKESDFIPRPTEDSSHTESVFIPEGQLKASQDELVFSSDERGESSQAEPEPLPEVSDLKPQTEPVFIPVEVPPASEDSFGAPTPEVFTESPSVDKALDSTEFALPAVSAVLERPRVNKYNSVPVKFTPSVAQTQYTVRKDPMPAKAELSKGYEQIKIPIVKGALVESDTWTNYKRQTLLGLLKSKLEPNPTPKKTTEDAFLYNIRQTLFSYALVAICLVITGGAVLWTLNTYF